MVGMDRLANATEVDKLHGRSDIGAISTQRFSCCRRCKTRVSYALITSHSLSLTFPRNYLVLLNSYIYIYRHVILCCHTTTAKASFGTLLVMYHLRGSCPSGRRHTGRPGVLPGVEDV